MQQDLNMIGPHIAKFRCPVGEADLPRCMREPWWPALWNEGLAQSSTLRTRALGRLAAKRVSRSWCAASV